jgi:S1-C subfamily serine protease
MNARVPFWSTERFEFEKVIALHLQNNVMHSPVTTGISFALIIGVVGVAFGYVAANPLEIVRTPTGTPWFGFDGRPLTPSLAQALGLDIEEGLLVTAVQNDGPADLAGLRGGTSTATVEGTELRIGGDIIIEVDGSRVTGTEEIRSVLERSQVGDTVNLTVIRGSERLNIPVTLGLRSG